MEINAYAYTIGIKYKFLPIYKNYKVVGHKNETVGDTVRLVMRCADGSYVTIPDIAKRQTKLYHDFIVAEKNLRELRSHPALPPEGLENGEGIRGTL